jgi:hypothetical protein
VQQHAASGGKEGFFEKSLPLTPQKTFVEEKKRTSRKSLNPCPSVPIRG